LRGGRPGHADPWRHGLQPRAAVRAHLPSPPAIPHHRGLRGSAAAARGAASLRICGQARNIMSEARDMPADARGIDFDSARLDAYLGQLLGGTSVPIAVERTQGGMSNPTYFLRRGSWRAVLRKQPGSVLLPSAHAIDREFRVLTALHGSDVPVPKPLHYCADPQ